MINENKSKLKKINISGFKSIDNKRNNALKLDLADINIIIGPNGAGKSNLISFFKMLNNMMTGALQTYIGQNGSAEYFFHFGSKKTPIIRADLEFINQKNKDVYSFSLVKAVQDSLIFSTEAITWNDRKIELASGQKESYLTSENVSYSSEKIVKMILSNCRAFQFHDTSSTSHIRNTVRIDNNRRIMSDGGNIAAYLYMLKNKSDLYRKYYNRIIEKIQLVIPQFNDFILEPSALNDNYIKLQWCEKDELDYILGSDQLSDGSIRFIALASLFLQPPDMLPNVIIIDEPELGLHPQAIDILASMIKTAAQHSQIIVATQSERLIDSFAPEQIIVAQYNNQKKCSEFKKLNSEELTDWLKDYSLSELWDKNVLGGQP